MTEILKFKLALRTDATITVHNGAGQPEAWYKPGAEAATTWGGVPSAEELATEYRRLQAATFPILAEVLESSRALLAKGESP